MFVGFWCYVCGVFGVMFVGFWCNVCGSGVMFVGFGVMFVGFWCNICVVLV